jgi:hypothetical protein
MGHNQLNQPDVDNNPVHPPQVDSHQAGGYPNHTPPISAAFSAKFRPRDRLQPIQPLQLPNLPTAPDSGDRSDILAEPARVSVDPAQVDLGTQQAEACPANPVSHADLHRSQAPYTTPQAANSKVQPNGSTGRRQAPDGNPPLEELGGHSDPPKQEPSVTVEEQPTAVPAQAGSLKERSAPTFPIATPSLVQHSTIQHSAVQHVIDLATQTLARTSATYQSVLPSLQGSLAWLKQRQQPLQWLAVWLTIFGSFGGVTGVAYFWLTNPPSADCRRVTIESMSVQRLYCAQELAQSGELADLAAGIALLDNWSAEAPLYDDAQGQISEWSRLILVMAQGQMAQGQLQQAIATVGEIPASSAVYPEAQDLIAAWQQEQRQGEAIIAVAQEAIKAQNWNLATRQVRELGAFDRDYWRLDQADALVKQIVREKQAHQQLRQAKKLAKAQSKNLPEAIGLLQQIPAHTHVSPEAQALLQEWSQTLVAVALEHWEAGDRATAATIALTIPRLSTLPAAGLDLIRLSQAHQLVADQLLPQSPELKATEIWTLLEALAAVQLIQPSSLFYQEAQAAQRDWQAQLQDLTQLSFANLIAWGGDRSTLELAVAQAQQISPERPHHFQAQALIAQWQEQIEAWQDRPYLARGQRWAATGQLPGLQMAIAQVQQIPSDRAAWQTAQDLIATWVAQIQTIEDQPTWDQAQKLAKQGKLGEAIDVALRIQPNRALHADAQAAIADWKAKLQAAEIAADQPLLDRAYALAARQRLTMAIDLASQIAPGRALHSEAQAAIDAWVDQRDSIWKSWSDLPADASATNGDPDDAAGSTLSDPVSTVDPAASQRSSVGYYEEDSADR